MISALRVVIGAGLSSSLGVAPASSRTEILSLTWRDTAAWTSVSIGSRVYGVPFVAVGPPGELSKDISTSRGFAEQQLDVVGKRAIGRKIARDLVGGYGDRAKRATKLMRRPQPRGRRARIVVAHVPTRAESQRAHSTCVGLPRRRATCRRKKTRSPAARAPQLPRIYVVGSANPPTLQGNGQCAAARTVMQTRAKTQSAIVLRSVRMVAETVTGASNRKANGFSRPPVR